MKIKELFYVKTGTRITEEDVYSHQGDFPCVTSQTSKNGITWYADEKWLESKFHNKIVREKECLTWTKDGAKAGTVFYRNYPFYPNDHCGVLITREAYRNEIDLKWFMYTFSEHIKSFATSNSAKPMLYKGTVEEIEIPYPFPDISKQRLFSVEYERRSNLENNLLEVKRRYDNLLNKEIINNYDSYQGKKIPPKDFLLATGGNSGLTEEFIYLNQFQKGEKYEVLSGASLIKNHMGFLPADARRQGKPLKLFDGEGLLVIRKGCAGTTRYLPKNKYTITDDAYILCIKPDSRYKVDLEWLGIQYKKTFLSFSSGNSNGTWNKEEFFKQAAFDIPELKEQKKLVKQFHRIYENQEKIQSLITKCTKLK